MKKIIFIFFINISSINALEMACKFEEVYQNGDSQSGTILIKNGKLRYQYDKKNLYTLIFKDPNILIIDNTYFNVQKVNDSSEKIITLSEIFNDYPDFKSVYNNKDLNIKIEKSSINFIRRIAIKSPEVNLSINLFDCELTKISDEFFNHFNFKNYDKN